MTQTADSYTCHQVKIRPAIDVGEPASPPFFDDEPGELSHFLEPGRDVAQLFLIYLRRNFLVPFRFSMGWMVVH
jgi:hypothetical protein